MGGGAVQVFFSGLCCGGYGTVEMVGGCGPFILCFLQFFVRSVGRWLSAVGLHFFIKFSLILVLFVGLVYYKLLILFDSLQVVEERYGPGGL